MAALLNTCDNPTAIRLGDQTARAVHVRHVTGVLDDCLQGRVSLSLAGEGLTDWGNFFAWMAL